MSDIKILENQSLKGFNSWRVGGEAQYLCLPDDLDELKACWQWADENGHAVTIIGDGTNSLVSDKGIKGLVIALRHLSGYEIIREDDMFEVSALAGTPKSQILREFLKRKLPPAEFLSGLPGNIGGGVVMNAGVSETRTPKEFCEVVSFIEVMRPKTYEIERIDGDNISWEYRHSSGWQPGIIVRAGIEWVNKPDPQVVDEVKRATKMRIMKQPLDKPSCGSVFRNPIPHTSGALVDRCGLKGFRVGGALVSEKHANFIVTEEGATASDVDAVIKHVQKVVKEKENIDLQTEVKYLGEW